MRIDSIVACYSFREDDSIWTDTTSADCTSPILKRATRASSKPLMSNFNKQEWVMKHLLLNWRMICLFWNETLKSLSALFSPTLCASKRIFFNRFCFFSTALSLKFIFLFPFHLLSASLHSHFLHLPTFFIILFYFISFITIFVKNINYNYIQSLFTKILLLSTLLLSNLTIFLLCYAVFT